MKETVGVALGGGAARALAHVGALGALETRGLAPQMVAGTSYGAFIAALYAAGHSAAVIGELMCAINMTRFWSCALELGWHQASFFWGRRFRRWLDETFFQGRTFAELELPLAVACTDTRNGELVVLREGPVARAVSASCALPGILGSVRCSVGCQERWLVDGGLVATVPFSALEDSGVTLRIGLHAGVRTEASRSVSALRRWHGSRAGQELYRRLLACPGESVWASSVRGLACVQASYEQTITAPPGARLISTNPPLQWWDFHKVEVALSAGRAATLAALDSWGYTETVRASSTPESLLR